MTFNRKALLWVGLGVLVAVEVVFLYPLLKALLQVAVIASRWPHLIADSAVFLQQQPLHPKQLRRLQMRLYFFPKM